MFALCFGSVCYLQLFILWLRFGQDVADQPSA